MRPDLHKVLTERPRHGRRLKTRRDNKPSVRELVEGNVGDRDFRPSFAKSKHFSDLLGPLRRWLRAQVNRPWDKVWSELSGIVDVHSVTGQHLLCHAREEVTMDCEVRVDRKIYVVGRWGSLPVRVAGLYVHPRTRLLRWQEPISARQIRTWQAAGRPAPELLPLGDGEFLRNERGLWFQVLTEVVPWQHRPKEKNWDFEFDRTRLRIIRKRQLSHRQLRDHGLSNAA